MTNSEINEFLGQFNASKNDKIQELETENTFHKIKQRKRWSVYDDSSLNQFEKSVLLLLQMYDARPLISMATPMTMQEMAQYLSVSITTIKRAINSLKAKQLVCHHPYGEGYCIDNTLD